MAKIKPKEIFTFRSLLDFALCYFFFSSSCSRVVKDYFFLFGGGGTAEKRERNSLHAFLSNITSHFRLFGLFEEFSLRFSRGMIAFREGKLINKFSKTFPLTDDEN